MRRGGGRGSGRGARGRGSLRGGGGRNFGARGVSAAGKAGFLSPLFALLHRIIPAGRSGWQPDGGGADGVDDLRVTRFPAPGPTVLPFPGRSGSPQKMGTRRRVSVDVEKCTGCGICGRVCPAGAIIVGSTAVIDVLRCTGCGRCVAECPQEALTLREMPRAENKISLLAKKEK